MHIYIKVVALLQRPLATAFETTMSPHSFKCDFNIFWNDYFHINPYICPLCPPLASNCTDLLFVIKREWTPHKDKVQKIYFHFKRDWDWMSESSDVASTDWNWACDCWNKLSFTFSSSSGESPLSSSLSEDEGFIFWVSYRMSSSPLFLDCFASSSSYLLYNASPRTSSRWISWNSLVTWMIGNLI